MASAFLLANRDPLGLEMGKQLFHLSCACPYTKIHGYLPRRWTGNNSEGGDLYLISNITFPIVHIFHILKVNKMVLAYQT